MSNVARQIGKGISLRSPVILKMPNISGYENRNNNDDKNRNDNNEKVDREFSKIHYIMRHFPNHGRAATAVSYTALTKDHIIGVTSTAAARTITLPLVARMQKGQIITVKDESGAAGTNNITIDGNGAETIDGAATSVISTNYGSKRLYCSGTAWFLV